VQLAPDPQQERLVGRLLGQGVLEGVLQLGQAPTLPDQLQALQLLQVAVHLDARLDDAAQHPEEEAAPDHRGGPQDVPHLGVQPVDARGDHIPQRAGDRDPLQRRADLPAAVDAPEGAEVDQRPDDLLHEERVPLRLLQDEAAHRGVEIAGLQEVAQELPAVLGGERVQRELRGAVGVVAQHRVAQPGGGGLPVRTADAAEEHGDGAHQRQEMRQQLAAGVIDPVQVLEDQHQRPLPRQRLEEEAHAAVDLAAHRLAIQVPHPLPPGLRHLQAQQGAQVGDHLPHPLGQHRRHPGLQLRPALPLGVGLGDAGGAAEDLQERPVADRAAERQGAAGEPGQGPLRDVAAHLRQQPGLADARLAEHHRDAAGALAQPLERLPQRRHLGGPADERRAHAGEAARRERLRPRPQAREGADPLVVPLHGEGRHRAEVERPPGGGVRGRADQDLAGPGVLLEAGGEVDHLARHQELPLRGGRRVRHHLAGGDPDPHLGEDPGLDEGLHAGAQRQGGVQGARGVVLVHGGQAEDGHHRIADELLHRPADALDRLPGDAEEPRHPLAQLLGVERRREARGAGDVGEEHGHHLALLGHGRRAGQRGPAAAAGRRPAGVVEPAGRTAHAQRPPRRPAILGRQAEESSLLWPGAARVTPGASGTAPR